MTKLLWFIPMFLLCTITARPSYADDSTIPRNSSPFVQTYWDPIYREVSIQTMPTVGNVKVIIQGNGQAVYDGMITPDSLVLIPLWRASKGTYKLTVTDVYGNSIVAVFVIE